MINVKVVEDLRKDIRDILRDLQCLNECMDCKKGPCIYRINRFGYAHRNSVYMHESRFYLKRCAPVRKRISETYNILILRTNDGRLIFHMPQELIENKPCEKNDISVAAFL